MAIQTKPRYKVVGELEQFDERNNVRARDTLQPGSEDYIEFYKRHPKLEARDAANRELSGKIHGHPLDFLFFKQQVGGPAQCGLEEVLNGPVAPDRIEISPERATEKIKGFARLLGADLVRTGPLNPAFIYSHIGRTGHDPARGRPVHDPGRPYGAPITLNHKNAISIAIGLDPALIKTGPVLSEITEMQRAYTQLATISTTIASYIRALGYPARAHIISNYQVLCVPIAIEAGMGELGRNGLMLTREFGNCLKLTTVTTDLPLLHDRPVDIGAEEFCRDCKICAENCPGGAISRGKKKVVRGVEKWAIAPEGCFRVWNETGSDCGVCVASCPWTKPRTPFHRFATMIATKKKKAGWWMSRAEKLFYGKFRRNHLHHGLKDPNHYGRSTGR